MIDIHSHILPHLDDGAKCIQETLEMLEIAIEDGIHTIVATPHFNDNVHDTTTDLIKKKFEEVQTVFKQKNMNIKLLLGAEVHIGPQVIQKLKDNKSLTLNNHGSYFLLEFPHQIWPPKQQLDTFIFNAQIEGFRPILCHPERNGAIGDNLKSLEKLVENDVLIQLTAGSITGKFGRKARKYSKLLLKNNMVHVVASDAHSINRRAPKLSEARKQVDKWVGSKISELIFEINPELIISSQVIYN